MLLSFLYYCMKRDGYLTEEETNGCPQGYDIRWYRILGTPEPTEKEIRSEKDCLWVMTSGQYEHLYDCFRAVPAVIVNEAAAGQSNGSTNETAGDQSSDSTNETAGDQNSCNTNAAAWHQEPAHHLRVRSDVQMTEILNYLSSCLADWHTLEMTLTDDKRERGEWLSVISDILQLETVILGSNFRPLAVSNGLNEAPVAPTDDTQAQQMIWNRDFFATQQTRGAFVFENDSMTDRMMYMFCYNVFVDGEFCVRFAVLFFDEWIRNCLAETTEYIGCCLEKYYQESVQDSEHQKNRYFRLALQHILNGENPESMSDIEQAGWRTDHEYRIFYFRTDNRYPVHAGGQYLQKQMEHTMGECCVMPWHNGFACIQNRTLNAIPEDEMRIRLVSFLTEFVAKSGISCIFRELTEAPLYMRQAETAMILGEKKNPMFWYFNFADYAYDYVLEQAVSEYPVEQILSPAIPLLLRRDQEKGSDLFHTLEVYLDLKCNGQASAKKLFIHRTSFIYRMNVIEQLIGMNVQEENNYRRLVLDLELYRRFMQE